jgi:hypothetical protein
VPQAGSRQLGPVHHAQGVQTPGQSIGQPVPRLGTWGNDDYVAALVDTTPT